MSTALAANICCGFTPGPAGRKDAEVHAAVLVVALGEGLAVAAVFSLRAPGGDAGELFLRSRSERIEGKAGSECGVHVVHDTEAPVIGLG